MSSEWEGLPPSRRQTFPASELRRQPKIMEFAGHLEYQYDGRAGGIPRHIQEHNMVYQQRALLGSKQIFLPVDDLQGAVEAEMRLYRRELRSGTPTMLKISALDLMSKEFSATSRSSARTLALPRIANDAAVSPWDQGTRKFPATGVDKNSRGRTVAGRDDEELFLGPVHPDSFRSSLRLAVLIGQCFSLLPTSSNPNIVPRFYYLSPRVLYSASVTFLLLLNAVLSFVRVNQIDTDRITGTSAWMFYLSATSVSVMHFRLAVQWPSLCLSFLRVERRMKAFGYPPYLQLRIRVVTGIVLSLAIVEYILALACGLSVMNVTKYESFHRFCTDYFAGNYPHLLLLFPNNPPLLLISQLLNTTATFMWNYIDLFIMLVSIAIAQRFKLLNIKIRQCPENEKTTDFWKDAREQYNALSALTREVDKMLCLQILFSFMNNLYFICIQLLHTVKHGEYSNLQNVYFVFSFGLLLSRTAFVSLFAASINDESKNVKKILYSVSSDCYCDEVDRFIIQATTDEIALTGLKFFYVTRSFLLTMAGTIATYEIVLVQFSGKKDA